MPNFGAKLAGAWAPRVSDALFHYQFNNPSAPSDLKQAGNLVGSILGRGAMNFSDDTGNVSVNPTTGQLEVMGNNFGFGINANSIDPSAEVKFKFGNKQQGVPVMMNDFLQGDQQVVPISPARQELENTLNTYRTTNPYWYRP